MKCPDCQGRGNWYEVSPGGQKSHLACILCDGEGFYVEGERMKLAIVGSVRLAGNKLAEEKIEEVLDKYKPDLVISGGAIGIDTMAKQAAEARGIEVLEYLPEQPKWHYYKKRNIKIAQNCDRLVRIYSNLSTTYGSGWTKNYTEEIGKKTEEYQIIEEEAAKYPSSFSYYKIR